jgi:hypothetical protein
MLNRFERKKISEIVIKGTVVAESENLILIHNVGDFEFDGYVVLRQRDLTQAGTSDWERHEEKIMRAEKLWQNPPKSVRSLPLDDWRALLTAFIGKTVIIENERKDDFLIGPVVSCDERAVNLHQFDAAGAWENVERMLYRDITCVQFGDRYSTIHARHLPPRPEATAKPRTSKKQQ